MQNIIYLTSVAFLLTTSIVCLALLVRKWREASILKKTWSPAISIADEVERLEKSKASIESEIDDLTSIYAKKEANELDRLRKKKSKIESEINELSSVYAAKKANEIENLNKEIACVESEIHNLRLSYTDKRAILTRLEKQLAIYDERIAFAEMGVYEPHFDYTDSEAFKNEIRNVREAQKLMVKEKTAVTCPTNWTVDGSTSKGRTMTNRQIRMTLRAFNNECEAAIANTRWNNINAMEKRIHNAASQIDKLNESNRVYIDSAYVQLKLQELFLTYEYREAQKRERDERAEIARIGREEQKLKKEAAAAEREREKYEKLLEKARAEIGAGTIEDISAMQSRIAELEQHLAAAAAESARAKSLAELTRSGYIYIISNIGSFGEEIVKIGMTRRLNPDDRVRELGDASVPFTFDTHAIIYSEDAPALEAALHTEFNEHRVNASNMRKEFFRVTLDDVENAVKSLCPSADFFKDREAQEYHETLRRREEQAKDLQKSQELAFPETL